MPTYACSECTPPQEIRGIFGFLYYAGLGSDPKHLNVEEGFYPINTLICSAHIGSLRPEWFIPDKSIGESFLEIALLGLLPANGYPQDSQFVVTKMWKPRLITFDDAGRLFPKAVSFLSGKLGKDLEERAGRTIRNHTLD